MTPQEKAFELYFKYYRDVLANSEKAKQCALIAVDEIIKHIEISYRNKDIIKGSKLYWYEVKQELNKL